VIFVFSSSIYIRIGSFHFC